MDETYWVSCLSEKLTSSSYGEGLETEPTSLPRQSLTRQNYAFNELVNEWHSDHVFKHNSEAIECFLLVTFLAYDIFHAFLALNIKPAARQGKAQVFWAKLIAAELYSEVIPASLSP